MEEVEGKQGRIDKGPIIAALKKENPNAALATILMYADAYVDYTEAQTNIDEHGAIVLHPRTGSPIDNPYIKIRDAAAGKLQRMRLKSDSVWKAKLGRRDAAAAKPKRKRS